MILNSTPDSLITDKAPSTLRALVPFLHGLTLASQSI